MNCLRLRRKVLAGMALAFAGASCAGLSEKRTCVAEFSSWAVELTWKHEWEAPPSDTTSGRYRFESLALVLKPTRVGEDQKIDGEAVVGTYVHGGTDWCMRAHRVAGTVRLLEIGTADVRARVDAVMSCPGEQPVELRGDFTFETKVPP